MIWRLFEIDWYFLVTIFMRYIIKLLIIENRTNYLLAKGRLTYCFCHFYVIKLYFFTKIDSYSFCKKLHIFHFFFFFCKKIIRTRCAMIAIIFEDLKLHCKTFNLLIKKSIIQFELYTQKNGKIEYLFYVIFLFFYFILIVIIV